MGNILYSIVFIVCKIDKCNIWGEERENKKIATVNVDVKHRIADTPS